MVRRAPQSQLRVAARLANGFLLDVIKMTGFGREVVDGLLMTAVSQANIALANRDPEFQRTYATLEMAPPDHLRRPASINAVAASLNMPFETARRRIRALAELGILQITAKGVILPQGPVASPFYRAIATGQYEMVRNLYHRLSEIGLLADLPRTPSPFTPADPPIRLVMRLSADYMLRLAEPVTRHMGDIVTGVILMDVIQANVEHLAAEGPAAADMRRPLRDKDRRPVRQSTLCERLGMPQETVRRHLKRLVERDLCERVDDGYVAPGRVLVRAPFSNYMSDNQTHLARMFGGLGELGALALWDAEGARASSAA